MKTLIRQTRPIETGKDWWELRAKVLALDLNREVGPVSLARRIWLRRN